MAWRLRLVAVAAVVGVALLVFATGLDDALRGDGFQDFLASPWGPAVYVLSMWIVQPVGLPGFVWMVPAGLAWSWPAAVALSWIGNLGASAIAFAWARFVARDWVASRIPPRVRAFDDRLARGGTAQVIALRLVTGQLPPADWLLGVTGVRWQVFFIGTAIGIVPGIVVFVVVGSSLFASLGDLVRG
ncbi:MAG: VTT domain-containing protein [Actinobacteria bacterium]|nr:VTT domain-containing protein [Actinomycetota bacterium]